MAGTAPHQFQRPAARKKSLHLPDWVGRSDMVMKGCRNKLLYPDTPSPCFPYWIVKFKVERTLPSASLTSTFQAPFQLGSMVLALQVRQVAAPTLSSTAAISWSPKDQTRSEE